MNPPAQPPPMPRGNGFSATLNSSTRWNSGNVSSDGTVGAAVNNASHALQQLHRRRDIYLPCGNMAMPASLRRMWILYATDISGNRKLNSHLPWTDSVIYWDAGGINGNVDRISKTASTSEYKGQWNNYVFVKNGSTGDMKIYLNGSLWHSGTGMTGTLAGITSFALFSYGGSGSGSYYGLVDDYRVYHKALGTTEIGKIYSAGRQ